MKGFKLLVTLFSISAGSVTVGFAQDTHWSTTEEASMKSNTPYNTEIMNYMDDMDGEDMSMSAGNTGTAGYNMEGSSSLRTGYGEGVSTNPGGQRGRQMEENSAYWEVY